MEDRAVKVVGGGVTGGGELKDGLTGEGTVNGAPRSGGALGDRVGVDVGVDGGEVGVEVGVEIGVGGDVAGGVGTGGKSGAGMDPMSAAGSVLSVEAGGVKSSPAPSKASLTMGVVVGVAPTATDPDKLPGGVGLGRVISGISNTHQKHYW